MDTVIMAEKMFSRQEIISKRHLSMVKKFNDELMAFAKYTDSEEATLYEDVWTSFTLSNVRVEDGYLKDKYDGKEEKIDLIEYDEDNHEPYERDDWESIPEYIKFWRSCLRRAKRYWGTDSETLDKMQDGEIEDTED